MASTSKVPVPWFRFNEQCELASLDVPRKHVTNSDVERAISFLSLYRVIDRAKTFVTYCKEIERFLMWCEYYALRSITKVDQEDLINYENFLKGPPKNFWCVKYNRITKKYPRVKRYLPDGSLNPDWRPFSGRLSANSIRKTFSIVERFYTQLVYDDYLSKHPRPPIARRKKSYSMKRSVQQRYLERELIDFTLSFLKNKAKRTKLDHIRFTSNRACYLILLLFHTGLRIEEVHQHKMGNFVRIEKEWFLDIVGKGRKERTIPIPDEFLDALVDYRQSLDLTKLPKPGEETPLVPGERDQNKAIGTRRIDQILKEVFAEAADKLKQRDPQGADKLSSASAHWLRHSYATYLTREDTPLDVVKENLGHSNIQVTSVYIETDNQERHRRTRAHTVASGTKKE